MRKRVFVVFDSGNESEKKEVKMKDVNKEKDRTAGFKELYLEIEE